jgi:DNA-binding NarL/FixJ family response regulator
MTESTVDASPIRVLSIKSSADTEEVVGPFLSQIHGLTLVAEVKDEPETVQCLSQSQIDISVIEYGVAESTRIELTRKIKEAYPKVRVLIVTASAAPEDIFAVIEAGADGYLLKKNLAKALEIAIRSIKLGAVWLDPGIAEAMLEVVLIPIPTTSRVLPTGVMPLPLLPAENNLLKELASSSCTDGVCLVDPSFLRKLKRFAPTT